MNGFLLRAVALALAVAGLAGCGVAVGRAGQPSASNVNPITGDRGGSGAASGGR